MIIMSRVAVLSLGILALAGCDAIHAPTPRVDYTIGVAHEGTKTTTIPPACAPWSGDEASPLDGQALPQFGCATARNLASMIETPDDLVEGRDLDNERGVTAVGAMRRYDNNQPRGLILPTTDSSQAAASTAATSSSALTGDITAGGTASAGAVLAP